MGQKSCETLYRRNGPCAPGSRLPLFVRSALGTSVTDEAGCEYLDFASGGWAPLGHNHLAMVAAVGRVGAAGAVPGAVGTHEVSLAAKLAEVVPGATNRRVFVCESGREALAQAIALGQAATGRKRVVYAADELSGDRAVDWPGGGSDVAVVVAAPLDSRLVALRSACDAAGALLVDDESGFAPGQTGRMTAIEVSGVRPDAYVFGRGWAGGVGFGACVTGGSKLHWETPGAGNRLGAAAALATIGAVEAGLFDQGRELAVKLDARLSAMAGKGVVRACGGEGLVWTLLLEPGRTQAAGFVASCRAEGLLVLECGPDAVGVRPALVATGADVERAGAALERVVAKWRREA